MPAVPEPGVPARTPVPAVKATPDGSTPVSARSGAGVPLAAIVNVPAEPTVNVAWFALVAAGTIPNTAVTPLEAFISRLHGPLPVQAPCHRMNTAPDCGTGDN